MPVSTAPPPVFPTLSPAAVLAFQFSAWYPAFAHLTIKSTVVRPLSAAFRAYLDADGVFVPEGSEDTPAQSALSDSDTDTDSAEDDAAPTYAFPELDARIRDVVAEYGAVFPKLNFSSPKDASWILPASSPLKCTTPSDVYLLLKSSDFIAHDLDPARVFDGCRPGDGPDYGIELVLRKWYPVDRSREVRCFVRDNVLLGVSQRDTNYYDFLNDPGTQRKITKTVKEFWQKNISGRWETPHYTVDLLLTRDLSRAHIVDFNPYAPRTDPLHFTYEELHALFLAPAVSVPQLRVIDSRSHPAAVRNVPANQHNMIPFEALSLSSGTDIEDFAERWQDEVRKAVQDDSA